MEADDAGSGPKGWRAQGGRMRSFLARAGGGLDCCAAEVRSGHGWARRRLARVAIRIGGCAGSTARREAVRKAEDRRHCRARCFAANRRDRGGPRRFHVEPLPKRSCTRVQRTARFGSSPEARVARTWVWDKETLATGGGRRRGWATVTARLHGSEGSDRPAPWFTRSAPAYRVLGGRVWRREGRPEAIAPPGIRSGHARSR